MYFWYDGSMMRIQRRFTNSKKEEARIFVKNRLAYFNQFYQFPIKRVAIKNQKTRWGSCSSKGNLNFNYKVKYLPAAFADYIIVHELCHLQELNHSKKFWALVAKTVPDFKQINKAVKKIAMNSI